MEYLVRLTDRAIRDLETIYQGIQAEWSDQAYSWFNHLVDAINSLEHHPERSVTTPESRTLRQLLYGTRPNIYRVIYTVNKRTRVVRVLHIRHGAMAPFAPEEFN